MTCLILLWFLDFKFKTLCEPKLPIKEFEKSSQENLNLSSPLPVSTPLKGITLCSIVGYLLSRFTFRLY